MKKVLIIGATSGIGRGLAELYSEKGWTVGATGRRTHLLEELKQSHRHMHIKSFDVLSDTATEQLQELIDEMDGIDMAIYSSGVAGVNHSLCWDIERCVAEVGVMGFTRIVGHLYNYFAEKGSGQLAAISSMAAIRGIDVSPSYSASKAYIGIYLEALRRKSVKDGCRKVKVSTIIPGFVATAIIDKSTPVFWMVDVPTATQRIYRGLRSKRRKIYTPKRWRVIAILAKLLPSYLQERV